MIVYPLNFPSNLSLNPLVDRLTMTCEMTISPEGKVVDYRIFDSVICSKKKMPVIFDTPLSRLDSAHREALIKTYFPNASEQTIILSTDSEIDERYYSMMKDSVGDEYTLNYCDKTRTTTIKPGYFGWKGVLE